MKTILISILGVSLFALTALFTSCSTAKVRVMPGENGIHKAIAKDIERDGAEEAAAKAAREYCEDKKMEAIFLRDSTNYNGDMDEATRKTVRKASTTAQVLGGVGSPVGTAGRAGHIMTNDRDYESTVEFKCK